jgi:hypothetical protein
MRVFMARVFPRVFGEVFLMGVPGCPAFGSSGGELMVLALLLVMSPDLAGGDILLPLMLVLLLSSGGRLY